MRVTFASLSQDIGDIALLAMKHLNCQTFYTKDSRGGGIPELILLGPSKFEAVIAGLTYCNTDKQYTEIRLYTAPDERSNVFYVLAVSESGRVIPCTHFSSPENNPLLYQMADKNNTEWTPIAQMNQLGNAYIFKTALLICAGSGLVFLGERWPITLIGGAVTLVATLSLMWSIFGGKLSHDMRRLRLDAIISEELSGARRRQPLAAT
ncbi:MAG: hypothetical protein KBD50_02795 [Candidatus Pacebacteria bacterium]|nr:hypothetical protein [Candidatus Paceibacterota bacterium]